MNFYEVSFLKSPLAPLTYQSTEEINIGTKVFVPLGKRRKNSAVESTPAEKARRFLRVLTSRVIILKWWLRVYRLQVQ